MIHLIDVLCVASDAPGPYSWSVQRILPRTAGVALLALLTACAEKKAPVPAPPPILTPALPSAASEKEGPAPPVDCDFAAYGDCRSDHDVHRAVCAGIVRSGARWTVATGDFVDWGSNPGDWEIFRQVTRELRAKIPYHAAKGNHDLSTDRIFEKEFGLERSWYDKRMGDVHLFVLDSNDDFTDAPQLAWLEEKAAASDAPHKIAAFHHPSFGIDVYGDFETKRIRERIHALLVRLRFCAAFCGHQHHFYTTRRDGVRYVITAGGGAPLYELDPARAQEGDLWRKFHHWVACSVRDGKITARVIDIRGQDVPELAFTVCEHGTK